MARILVLLVPVLLALSAGCSRHATYGRPMPRDTLPSSKEPENLKPPRTGATVPPRCADGGQKEGAC
jgi:hypothetical protein